MRGYCLVVTALRMLLGRRFWYIVVSPYVAPVVLWTLDRTFRLVYGGTRRVVLLMRSAWLIC